MKKRSISTYIIALLALSSLLALPTRLSAQQIKIQTKEEAEALDSKLLSIISRNAEINIVNKDYAVDMICQLILKKL